MRSVLLFVLGTILVVTLTSCNLMGNQDKQTDIKRDTSQAGTDQTGVAAEENAGEDTKSSQGDVQGKKIKMKLYYANSDNSAVRFEEREVEVLDGAVVRAALNALLDSPRDKNLRKAIPEGTRILDVNKKGNVAIINLSKEYNHFGGSAAEIVARVSIANTLTEIQGIDKVRFLIEGKDLIGPSGNPFGELGRVALDEKGSPVSGERKTLVLYFGNDNADKVAAEKREVDVPKDTAIEKLIFEELKKGPFKKSLHPVIPKEARLLSVSTKDGICTLNLSPEFVDNHSGGSAGESMTVNSIVNSLTELPNVKKVQFLIEGKKREVYLHLIFSEPFSRNEAIIQK